MTEQKPTIGIIVWYTLSQQDATEINRRRAAAAKHQASHRERDDGSQVYVGNSVGAGQVFPMVITSVWGDQPTSAVNGQVILDGNDVFWATSVAAGEGGRHYTWPQRS